MCRCLPWGDEDGILTSVAARLYIAAPVSGCIGNGMARHGATRRASLAEERFVVAVVLADEFFDAFQIGPQAERARDRVRLLEHVRIVNRELVAQRVERGPG